MKKLLPLLIPVIMLGVLTTAILDIRPMVFFVASEEKIPAIVREVVKPPVIKAGQVWATERDKGNPFDEKSQTAAHVVAVKDGYVKYYFAGQEGYGEWAAQSDSADWFARVFTKRVK